MGVKTEEVRMCLACDVNISLLLLTCEKGDSFLHSCGALFLFVKWHCGWGQSDQDAPRPEHSRRLGRVLLLSYNLQQEPAQLLLSGHGLE